MSSNDLEAWDANEHSKRITRRPGQFGLRSLLLAVAAVALLLGWTAHRWRRNTDQSEAVDAIWEHGGLTSDDLGQPFLAPLSGIDPRWGFRRNWLDHLLGAPSPVAVFFPRPTWRESTLSDGDIDQLAEILRRVPSVRWVDFEPDQITEDGLRRLGEQLPGVKVCQAPERRR